MKKNVLLYGFYALLGCLSLLNCSTKDDVAIVPSSFQGLTNIKLPEAKLLNPAEVKTTDGSIVVSQQAVAALAELTSGKISASTLKLGEAISAAIPAAVLNAALDELEGDKLYNDTKSGTLSTAQLTLVESLKKLPVEYRNFFSKVTMPTVDGIAVSGQESTTDVTGGEVSKKSAPAPATPVNNVTSANPAFTACRELAQNLAASLKSDITKERDQQLALVQQNYNTNVAAFLGSSSTCLSAARDYQDKALAANSATYAEALAKLESIKRTIPAETYRQMRIIVMAYFLDQQNAIRVLFRSTQSACRLTTVRRQAAIELARDTNIAQVLANYQEAIQKIDLALIAAINKCHNQGGGK
jgi:hypothetical protein